MKISKATPADAQTLTDLTFQSKAHWNYGASQMEKWRAELTISESYIRTNAVFKLLVNDELVGYYSFFEEGNESVKLDNLFILPQAMGKGYGKLLIEDFTQRAKSQGFQRMTLDADPNAEAFYHKLGFQVVGQLPTSIAGRFMPVMEKVI